MTLYSVFERSPAPSDDPAPAVVAEKFSWFAALLPPVYGLVHGLWLGLLGFVLLVAVLTIASFWLGGEAVTWLYILAAILIGFEAPAVRRAKLQRAGWTYRAEIVASAEDLAQSEWLKRKTTSIA